MLAPVDVWEITKGVAPGIDAGEIVPELCATCETLFSLAVIKAAKIEELVTHTEKAFSTARQAALDFNPARKTPADAG